VARQRSPNRDKALQIFLEHEGNIKNRDIAEMLGEKEKTISNWKSRDQWNVVLQKGECSTSNKKSSNGGAPQGNKNAERNIGGAAPRRNKNAVSHGLFRKYLPDDEETREIYDAVDQMNPLDMLWEKIRIAFTNLIRSQKLMFVQDQDDIIKVLKKEKSIDNEKFSSEEREWEFQFPWDRQASLLQSQARAMSTLSSMIRQYEEMCRLGQADEEQQMRLDKLKAEVKALGVGKDKEPLKIEIDYGDDES
jgi:phage terminase small subunit